MKLNTVKYAIVGHNKYGNEWVQATFSSRKNALLKAEILNKRWKDPNITYKVYEKHITFHGLEEKEIEYDDTSEANRIV